MSKFFNLLAKKPKLTVKFSDDMNSYVVVKKDHGILYAGPKEQCQSYVRQHT